MEPRYGDSLAVVYKDTDSLLYRIETDDFYMDMKNFAHLLDLSEYPKNHKLHDPTNKKVPLTMKDELTGLIKMSLMALYWKKLFASDQNFIVSSSVVVSRRVPKVFSAR